jgi:hypothetical protein
MRSTGSSVERIIRARQFNRGLEGLLVGVLGFSDGVGANIYFAFRFRHSEKIGEQIEAARNSHGLKLSGHIGDISGNIERLPRNAPVRRIVGPSRRPRGAVPYGSRFSAYPSRETHFLNHAIALSRSAEEAVPLRRLAPGSIALFNARVAMIRTRP